MDYMSDAYPALTMVEAMPREAFMDSDEDLLVEEDEEFLIDWDRSYLDQITGEED